MWFFVFRNHLLCTWISEPRTRILNLPNMTSQIPKTILLRHYISKDLWVVEAALGRCNNYHSSTSWVENLGHALAGLSTSYVNCCMLILKTFEFHYQNWHAYINLYLKIFQFKIIIACQHAIFVIYSCLFYEGDAGKPNECHIVHQTESLISLVFNFHRRSMTILMIYEG